MTRRKRPAPGEEAPREVLPSEPSTESTDGSPVAASGPDAGFLVVGLGASAGGLAAFESFLSLMPADAGMAYVLVSHLWPDHRSMLVELLQRSTQMPVSEVEDGTKVEPDRVYVIPPNRDMTFRNGMLHLSAPTAPRGLRLPIDLFFRSLAEDHHERAVCIVLSGTGSDGTLGIRAVKGEGGLVMAQDPDSTEYGGMPQSAIATGLVDFVLPPAEMPAQLIAYANHALGKELPPASAPAVSPGDVSRKICAVLHSHTGHDFSEYKESTLLRRIERRMAIRGISHPADYLACVQTSPAEAECLFHDLLIGVTSFFRDPEAFRALQAEVVPRLLASSPSGRTFRIWVCGCSTGEEAYSLAILVQEQLEKLRQASRVQIFATDIDRRGVDAARAGVYPASIAADVTPERLGRFFTQDAAGGTFRVERSIRDMLIFSEQDVMKDPPFSRMDMISCRNLLIYMNASLQRRLMALFHYALKPRGLLFLGTSESVGDQTALFETIDRKSKLYVRRADGSAGLGTALAGFVQRASEIGDRSASAATRGERRDKLHEITEQTLLQQYGPSAVLVNGRGDIFHVYGRTGRYLEPAQGDAGLNVLSMAREGLRRELATALHRAASSGEPVSYPALRIRSEGGWTTADLIVCPAIASGDNESGTNLFLVILHEMPTPNAAPAEETDDVSAGSDRRIVSLEHELRAKDEFLQTALEEMESSNQELRSSNEELQSVNEELQSNNEELETSQEELQSVNEELATVNAELQIKVNELTRANDDMDNLLAGTGVATLFVDPRLRITRFTPAIAELMNLIPTDVGRPVGHVVTNLVGYDRLVEDLKSVVETLVPTETEVQAKTGAWYLLRLCPYRTLQHQVEGAVITFVDITRRKGDEETIRRQLTEIESYYDTAPIGLAVVDADLRYVRINHTLAALNGLPAAVHIGRSMEEIGPPLPSRIRELTAEIVRTRKPAPGVVVTSGSGTQPGVTRTWLQGWHPIRGEAGDVTGFSVFVQEITEGVQLEEALRTSDRRLAADLDALKALQRIGALFVGVSSLEQVLDEVVDAAIAITGADMSDVQLLEPATGALRVAASRGFERAWLDSGTSIPALVQGGRVIVEDVTESPLFAGTPALAASVAAGVRAVQSTPLQSRNGVRLGTISTYTRAPSRPDERALRLLDLLARQTADILEGAERSRGS